MRLLAQAPRSRSRTADPGASPQTPALTPRLLQRCSGTLWMASSPGPLKGFQSSGPPSRDTPPLTATLRPDRSDDARATRPDTHRGRGRTPRLDGPPRATQPAPDPAAACPRPGRDARCRSATQEQHPVRSTANELQQSTGVSSHRSPQPNSHAVALVPYQPPPTDPRRGGQAPLPARSG